MKQAATLTERQLKQVLSHCLTRPHAARDRAIVMVSGFIHNGGSGRSGVGAAAINVIHVDHGTLRIPAFNALWAGADGPYGTIHPPACATIATASP